MQVHVINLKEAIERRKSITSQLEKLGIRYEIFDAIRGSSLSEKELHEKVDMQEVARYPNWLTPNMLGCSLSHLGVYRRIAESGTDWHLILEDDVELDPNIVHFMETFEQTGNKFQDHVVLLYGVKLSGNIILDKESLFEEAGRTIHKVQPNQHVGSTGAYLIHKATARKMLENNPLVKVAPDTWHFFRDQGSLQQLNCVYPFLSRPALFESTIGYVDKKSLKYKLKHFVEQVKVPVLYQLLKRSRKITFTKMSKVEFV